MAQLKDLTVNGQSRLIGNIGVESYKLCNIQMIAAATSN